MSKVLVTMPTEPEEQDSLRFALPEVRFRFVGASPSDADLAWAEIVLGNLGTRDFDVAQSLTWLHSPNASLDAYTFGWTPPSSVRLTHSKNVVDDAVAEHGVAMLLALIRNLPTLIQCQLDRKWGREEFYQRGAGPTLRGLRALILGYGAIAHALVPKLHGLGLSVDVFRRVNRDAGPLVDRVYVGRSLPEGLKNADVVMNLLPLNDETDRLLSRQAFEHMKPGAYFVNLGRGRTIAEEALVDCLSTGRLAGAALDVFEVEPLPSESPLWGMPTVILSPHVGGRFRGESMANVEQFIKQYRALHTDDD